MFADHMAHGIETYAKAHCKYSTWSNYMGHHSIQVTVDIYGHLIPGSNKQAADRLDSILDPPSPQYGKDARKSRRLPTNLPTTKKAGLFIRP